MAFKASLLSTVKPTTAYQPTVDPKLEKLGATLSPQPCTFVHKFTSFTTSLNQLPSRFPHQPITLSQQPSSHHLDFSLFISSRPESCTYIKKNCFSLQSRLGTKQYLSFFGVLRLSRVHDSGIEMEIKKCPFSFLVGV